MKYFTREWWDSGCEDESIIKKYQEYYLSISPRLPEPLRTLEEKYTLHDSNIKFIKSDFVNKIITINLIGWDRGFNKQISYEIKFIGVKEFTQSLPLEEYVESDLGYWEYEVNENIEMKMLFSSDAQFNIVFNDFEFNAVPA